MKKKEQPVQILDFAIPDTTPYEGQVLADIVSNPVIFPEVQPILHPDFFSLDSYRRVWDTLVDFNNNGKEITLATLLPVLRDDLRAVMVASGENAGSLHLAMARAGILRDMAAKKRTYTAIARLLEQVNNPATNEQDIFADLETFNHTVEGPAPLNTEREIGDIIKDVKKDLDRTRELIAKGEPLRIPTGFDHLDTILNGGFKPGQLVILAARPSVGKTALMLQLASNAAENDYPAQVYSLEMTAQELAERLIFSTGHVYTYELSNGTVSDSNFEQAELTLDGLRIYVNDFSRSLDDIISKMSLAVRKGRCKIAFIDYLGLMSDALNFSGANVKLYQVIARITGTLKAAAKRLGIPIVLLCQLNREQVREGRSPELFDLRDSGSIEQDADVVLMLESNYTDKDGREFPLVAWLRKNRGGEKDKYFAFVPNKTYSHFTAVGWGPKPQEDAPTPAPEPTPAELLGLGNVNGLGEDEDFDELPF